MWRIVGFIGHILISFANKLLAENMWKFISQAYLLAIFEWWWMSFAIFGWQYQAPLWTEAYNQRIVRLKLIRYVGS